jgi:hypothetical protein
MKKWCLILCAALIMFSITCGKKSVEITLSLTNPNNKAVPFDGYYKLPATGDSVAMDGATPEEYIFTLEKGENATGLVYKDTIDIVDTLHFRILFDGEEKNSYKTTTLIEQIQFTITAQ